MFEAHDADANFLSNQVWVWTGSNVVDNIMTPCELLDRNGLFVDLYTYVNIKSGCFYFLSVSHGLYRKLFSIAKDK